MVNFLLTVILSFCIKVIRSIYFFLYLLLIIIILHSCATLKKDELVEGQIKITDKNLHLLNGKYSRFVSLYNPGDLFESLFGTGYTLFESNVDNTNLYSVELKVIDNKHIKAILFKNNSILKSRALKGKLKSGYFEFKRRYLILPIIYVNFFATSKFRIGILKNGNLTTDFKKILWGTGHVVLPVYNKDYEPNVEYKRLY